MKIGMPTDGRFGDFGGKYIPETLVPAIEELEENYEKIKNDETFQKELDYYLKSYAGRPTPLYFAKNLTNFEVVLKSISRERICFMEVRIKSIIHLVRLYLQKR